MLQRYDSLCQRLLYVSSKNQPSEKLISVVYALKLYFTRNGFLKFQLRHYALSRISVAQRKAFSEIICVLRTDCWLQP